MGSLVRLGDVVCVEVGVLEPTELTTIEGDLAGDLFWHDFEEVPKRYIEADLRFVLVALTDEEADELLVSRCLSCCWPD